MERDTVVQEIPPGAGVKTSDFGTETFGRLPWNDSNPPHLLRQVSLSL